MTATTPPTAAALISELRPHCGNEVEVTTPSGPLTGTLFSVCSASIWLVVNGVDQVVPIADLSGHRVLDN